VPPVIDAGVETVSLRCSLGNNRPADRIVYNLDHRKSPHLDRFTVRKPPPGISGASYKRTPDGWWAEIEGNLTTLLHGPGSEVGSLSGQEVPVALEVLAYEASRVLGGPVSGDLFGWDVTRYDPSTTLLLPPDVHPSSVVLEVHRVWDAQQSGYQTVTMHNSGSRTALLLLDKSTSRTVYDKSGQAQRQGKPCPPGALRLESRCRPKNPVPASYPGVIVSDAAAEIATIAQAIGKAIPAAAQLTVHTLVEAQKLLGEEPNVSEALTLSTVMSLLQQSNGDVWILTQEGMSKSAAYRRKARLQRLLSVCDEALQDSAANDVYEWSTVLLARDVMDHLPRS